MSDVCATFSEKVATFLDPLERRRGVFAPRDLHWFASDTHRQAIKMGAMESEARAL
jgi:hypothetical protein